MSCGSTNRTSFSHIDLAAQPGNIINTPNAADGEILVFVEDTDYTDCNGKGQYLNFKPLVFDLRGNTGHGYLDMGVSVDTAGTVEYLTRLARWDKSWPNTNYNGVASVTDGMLGINTIDSGEPDPLAHLHISSAYGPTLYLDSIASGFDPIIWLRHKDNEVSGTQSGTTAIAQRDNISLSFERSYFDGNLDVNQTTRSIMQFWQPDNTADDIIISIRNIDMNRSVGASKTSTTVGTFRIEVQDPELLLRSTNSSGAISNGNPILRFTSSSGTNQTIQFARTDVSALTNTDPFIRRSSNALELGHASTASVTLNNNSLLIAHPTTINDPLTVNGTLGVSSTTTTNQLIVSNDAYLRGEVRDKDDQAGTSGQILTSTGTGVDWQAPPVGGMSIAVGYAFLSQIAVTTNTERVVSGNFYWRVNRSTLVNPNLPSALKVFKAVSGMTEVSSGDFMADAASNNDAYFWWQRNDWINRRAGGGDHWSSASHSHYPYVRLSAANIAGSNGACDFQYFPYSGGDGGRRNNFQMYAVLWCTRFKDFN